VTFPNPEGGVDILNSLTSGEGDGNRETIGDTRGDTVVIEGAVRFLHPLPTSNKKIVTSAIKVIKIIPFFIIVSPYKTFLPPQLTRGEKCFDLKYAATSKAT